MSSLEQYILSSLEEQEKEKLLSSPSYMAGAQASKLQPESTRGWGWGDYLGYGAAKGLVSGGLMGYGKGVMNREMEPQYMSMMDRLNAQRDPSSQMDLGPLSENFSTTDAKPLITQMLVEDELERKDNLEENKVALWLRKNKMTADVTPEGKVDYSTIRPDEELQSAELEQARDLARAKQEGKDAGKKDVNNEDLEILKRMPMRQREAVTELPSFNEAANLVKQKLADYNENRVVYQAAGQIGATRASELKGILRMFDRDLAKMFNVGVLTDRDVGDIREAIQGDPTVGTMDIYQRVENAQELVNTKIGNIWNTWEGVTKGESLSDRISTSAIGQKQEESVAPPPGHEKRRLPDGRTVFVKVGKK